MSKKRALLEEVISHLPKKGTAPWHTRLPPDLLAELQDVKARFERGEIRKATKTGLALAISKSLKARGIDVGHRGVEAWLQLKS